MTQPSTDQAGVDRRLTRADRLRSWLVPAVGGLVLASSFAPWWSLKLADGGSLSGEGVAAVTAWQTVGWWPPAVAVAVAAAVVWTGWHLIAGTVPGRWRALLSLAGVASILLAAYQWRSIPRLPPLPPAPPAELTLDFFIQPGDRFTTPGIDPNRLYVDDSGLAAQGPGWGLYLGIAALILLTAALLISPATSPRPAKPQA